MPADRTVLPHLLEGRDALLREIARLSAAKDELDSVIAQVRGAAAAGSLSTTPVTSEAATNRRQSADRSSPEGRNRSARTQSRRATPPGVASKSIRVHVLEMLGAEDREFGLAEIIDRIHAQGIQAHDDAVRSITVKLMKDGTVERVGRGQYRLAARPSSPTTALPPATAAPAADPGAPDYAARALNLAQPWERPQG